MSFNVTVEARGCPPRGTDQSFTIKPVGFKDRLEVAVDYQCDCGCSQTAQTNSSICSSIGASSCCTFTYLYMEIHVKTITQRVGLIDSKEETSVLIGWLALLPFPRQSSQLISVVNIRNVIVEITFASKILCSSFCLTNLKRLWYLELKLYGRSIILLNIFDIIQLLFGL